METSDVIKLKEGIKEALKKWTGSKIDALFPKKPQTRVILKRGLYNYLEKEDLKINSMVERIMLFVGDENGVINTDTAIDMLIDLFKEMDVQEYKIGIIPITVGKGEFVLTLPHNPLLDMLVGELGKVTIKAEDILEMKKMFVEA